MATKYRFRREGVDAASLQNNLPIGTVVQMTPALPKVFMDVEIEPSGPEAEMDLIAAMDAWGWELFQTSPALPLRGVTIIQNYVTTLAADRTVNSGTWEDLITQDLNTETSALGINGTISSSSVGGDVLFRVLVDGVQVLGLGHGPGLGGNGLNRRIPVAQGPHQVKLQWKNAGTSAEISPVTRPDEHHATLMISEVVS